MQCMHISALYMQALSKNAVTSSEKIEAEERRHCGYMSKVDEMKNIK
jgi:hypothetical protein